MRGRWGRVARFGIIAAALVGLAWPFAWRGPIRAILPNSSASAAGGLSVDARLLLVGAGGALQAMRTELNYIGIPYTVVTSAALPSTPLTDSPSHGLYNGVILEDCSGANAAAATPPSSLGAYLATFEVRLGCLYIAPDAGHGFGTPEIIDTRASPVTLSYTRDGLDVFGWYATPAPVVVTGVPASVAPIGDNATRPLLVDARGRAGAAIHVFPDGREVLLLTFDQAPGALHSRQLLAGVASWVSRGVFIGEKRAFFGAQVDDLFMGTVQHDGTTYRMSGDDLRNAARWQAGARAGAAGGNLMLTLPFNGAEVRDDDPLTQAAREVGGQFQWVSHTFDHHRLDYADYTRMTQELTQNDAVMTRYGFGPYDRSSLVTPDVSGLMNAPVMQAAADFGIRQLVCDASYATCDPPVPNTAIFNPLVATLLLIPRVATNLYANVSTPSDWVALYNTLYQASTGRPLAHQEIVDRESDALLVHLLAGDMAPWMFHQANLRVYDGAHTLLTDVLGALLQKYGQLRTLPMVTLTMADVAARLRARTNMPSAGLVGTVGPGPTITLHATQPIRVPVTGARAGNAEAYGSVIISIIDVPAGGAVAIPLASAAASTAPDAASTGPDAASTAPDAASTGLDAANTAPDAASAAPDAASTAPDAAAVLDGAASAPHAPTSSGGCGCALGSTGSSRRAETASVVLMACAVAARRRRACRKAAGVEAEGAHEIIRRK